jgi:hypothetical protein
MNKKLVTLAVCLLTGLTLTPCLAETAKDPLAELQAGLPLPVAALIERIVDCAHWGGEEPYDAARRAEINKAVRELRCTALERDEKRLLKTWGQDERVRSRINKAKEGIL